MHIIAPRPDRAVGEQCHAVIQARSNRNNIGYIGGNIRLSVVIFPPGEHRAIALAQTVSVPDCDGHYVAEAGRRGRLAVGIEPPSDYRAVSLHREGMIHQRLQGHDIAQAWRSMWFVENRPTPRERPCRQPSMPRNSCRQQ